MELSIKRIKDLNTHAYFICSGKNICDDVNNGRRRKLKKNDYSQRVAETTHYD